MKVIIDRFEENVAVVELEEGVTINVDRRLFPNCKEGDCIEIKVDSNENEKRKKHIKELSDKLFED